MDNFEFGDSDTYDKNKIKYSLSLEQVAALVDELGGESQIIDNYLVAKTICHNTLEENGSHKLYYYENTHLFHCFTDCGDSFDIYELVCRVKNINKQFKAYSKDGKIHTRKWELFDAIPFVLAFYNLNSNAFKTYNNREKAIDWNYLSKYEKELEEKEDQIVELKHYDDSVLKYLPHPRIIPWEHEGITKEVMDARGIAFDPVNYSIIIPHYDIDNNLVGIRARTLIKEDEIYGKYRPAYLNGRLYNHPLGFNLFNLNNSKSNISSSKIAIIGEGEKFSFMFSSYFGITNDITVAVCGSSFTLYQFNLLKSLGVKEIVIAFDKQFQKIGDDEWKRWTKKLTDIHSKYGTDVQISYMFDKGNLLDYKDSPIDKGAEIFMKLFKERIYL